jgi:hypothetical protein
VTDCFVFYEDQSARGAITNFGPHRLLCSCVADRLGDLAESRQLQKDRIGLRPCRGVGDQVRAIVENATQLLEGGTKIFALFDNDKIREQLGLLPNASSDQVTSELRARNVREEVRIYLLEQNTETLMQAALVCLHAHNLSVTVNLPAKKPLERDRILNGVADAQRAIRDCVENRVPSFMTIVDAIAQTLQPFPESSPPLTPS